MTITHLLPTVKGLSHTDKLILLQVLVQEILQAEGVTGKISTDDILSQHLVSFQQSSLDTDEEEADEEDFTLEERIEFLRKSPAEQGKMLAEQAEKMRSYYEQDTEWKEWLAGDIVEY